MRICKKLWHKFKNTRKKSGWMGTGAQRERPSRTWDLYNYQHSNTYLCYEQPKRKGMPLQKSHSLRKTNKNISYSEQSCSFHQAEVIAVIAMSCQHPHSVSFLGTWADCTTGQRNREVAILRRRCQVGLLSRCDWILSKRDQAYGSVTFSFSLPGTQLDCVFAKYKTCAGQARFWRCGEQDGMCIPSAHSKMLRTAHGQLACELALERGLEQGLLPSGPRLWGLPDSIQIGVLTHLYRSFRASHGNLNCPLKKEEARGERSTWYKE